MMHVFDMTREAIRKEMADNLYDVMRTGILIDLDPDFSRISTKGFGSEATRDKAKGLFERLREARHHDDGSNGRLFRRNPRYNLQDDDRISSFLDNIPDEILVGDFQRVRSPTSFQAFLYCLECGEIQLAREMIDRRESIGETLCRHLGAHSMDRNYYKELFVEMMFKPLTGRTSEYDKVRNKFPNLRQKRAARMAIDRTSRVMTLAYLLGLTRIAADRGITVVGYRHDEILIQTGDPAHLRVMEDEAVGLLVDLLERRKPQDPLEDALQWLRDCGGKMAFSNNPKSQQLINAGLAKKGGFNHLGQRTILLVE